METWQVYLLTRADGIRSIFSILNGIGISFTIVLGLISVISLCISGAGDNQNDRESAKRFFKAVLPYTIGSVALLFSTAFIQVIVPTTKEMAAIVAIPMIASNEQVQKLPGKVLDLADEWLEELRPRKASPPEEKPN